MDDFSRRTWEPADVQNLLDMWPRVMSIVLIALELRRSTSSVQTQASRKGLPRRTEGNERHRRKWTADDIRNLRDTLDRHTDEDGMVHICEIADDMGRSIDAVAQKLYEFPEFGGEEALFEVIKVTKRSSFGVATEVKNEKTGDTRKQGKKRPCMTCNKVFWSEGAHNRMCSSCKRDEGGSDWDW